MTLPGQKRKGLIIALATGALVFFLFFAALNAFSLKFLSPSTTGQIVVFTALSALAFLLFLVLLLLLVRNVLKLYADQKSRVMGSRLRTRMLLGAILISILPLSFMFGFSYLLMNRAVDRWFSQPPTQMREDATRIGLQLSQYISSSARVEAESIASSLPAPTSPRQPAAASATSATAVASALRAHEITLQGGFAVVFRDNQALAALNLPTPGSTPAQVKSGIADRIVAPSPDDDPEPPGASPDPHAPPTPIQRIKPADIAILTAAQRPDNPIFTIGGTDFALGLASAVKQRDSVSNVVVGLPLPPGMSSTMADLRTSSDQYSTLYRARRSIRNTYMRLLLMLTALALFASTWLALHLSKQVTKPVEALADAMASIAAGDYAHRVEQSATEELGELVQSFNHMAQDLEGSRAQVEASTALLSAANATLEARRAELETMLETIPNGVATLSADGRILLANRALSELMDPGGQTHFLGRNIAESFPPDLLEALDRLMRRSHRMGSASSEVEMASGGLRTSPLNLLITVALLETAADRLGARAHLGYVLVLENATELLRAQQQSAWKEVARRVAHEIKNPLTPISLSAEQIARHADRLESTLAAASLDSPSIAVIQRCSQVISASVESMRGLVDQFAALAQFPTARPRPADLNTIVENSLALFAGRTENIRVLRRLAPDLPLVLADPEAMKRALGNLIDNAVEAMSTSLLREMRISTSLLPSGLVELALADTGTGLTDDMRERLFLPYFSTKQRGTGLGLAIAAKIIQEHGGSIRAEKNDPAGAKFLIELPVASTNGETINAEHLQDVSVAG